MDNHKLQEWYIYHQCLVRFFSVTRKLVRNQLLQVVILSYQISLVIRPVLLPKSYLSCAVPLALLLILQLYIAFLIIISPQLFKISHSSMLPAVVFFPNALHLQRKKKKPKQPHRFRFLWTLFLLLFSSWDKWKQSFFALKSVIF